MTESTLRRRVRLLIWFFIIGLVVSGATALPLQAEVNWLTGLLARYNHSGLVPAGLMWWLTTVRSGLAATYPRYPFIAYGTDWLAFGHFMIALAFLGPLRNPVKNAWVIDFGVLACALVVPYAMVMGAVRGIPLGWRLIDCAFGVFGVLPLWLCRSYVRRLAAVQAESV